MFASPLLAALRASRVRCLPSKKLGQSSSSSPTKPTKGDGKDKATRKDALTGRALFLSEIAIPAELRADSVPGGPRIKAFQEQARDSWRALPKDKKAKYNARAADLAGLRLAEQRKIEELLGRTLTKPFYSAKNLFVSEYTPQARAEAATETHTAPAASSCGRRVMQIFMREWLALGEAKKAEYAARVLSAKAAFKADMRAFKAGLTERERALLDAEGTGLRVRHRHLVDAPRPSAYLDFMAE